LEHELKKQGFFVERQKPIGIEYDGRLFDEAFSSLAPVHHKQLLTYLKLSKRRVGLLRNFGSVKMKNGIKRIVNGY
jgi:iron complex transport system substrate-binding protein